MAKKNSITEEMKIMAKRDKALTWAEQEIWNNEMRKRKITSYTAVDSEFVKDTTDNNCYEAYMKLCLGECDDERIMEILEECVSGRARLIYYYPPCTTKIQDNWEWIAEILDGAIYLEKIGG